MGTPIDLDKMRSIGVISKRTAPTVREGTAHPESGLKFKSVTDELGHTVTTHTEAGSGVDCRQDVNMNPETTKIKFTTELSA